MSPLLRSLLREPLVHFLLVGGALFAFDGAVAGGSTESRRLVVGSDVRASLAADWEQSEKRAPTEEELQTLVTRWIDDEILYREGLARGLDRDDPRVRERVASKMARILEQSVTVPEPTEAEITAFFEERRDRFSTEALVDFTQVFVEGRDDAALARANELLAALKAGADPAKMGDTFQGGRRYRRRKLADLASAFGDEFVEGLGDQPEQTWERRASKLGFHLVRVDKKTAGEDATLESARLDVVKAWKDARRAEGVARAMAALRSEWSISR